MSTINSVDGLSASLWLGAGAMHSYSRGMAVTAHNIANVSTDDFTPSRAVYSTGPDGRGNVLDAILPVGPTVGEMADLAATDGVRSQTPARPSGTELARELPQMVSTQRAYEANAQVVRSADAMTATLLNIVA